MLELLASSSREIAELEVHEAQIEQGPCIDAWRTNTAVSMTGPDEIIERWPSAGPVIVGQGYSHVHATPRQ